MKFLWKVLRNYLEKLERGVGCVDCYFKTKKCWTLSRFKPIKIVSSSSLSEVRFTFNTMSWCFWGSISQNRFVLDTCFEKPHIFSAHSFYLLNNLTLKEWWAIILIKGKLETREAYTSVAFREARMHSVLF